MTFPYETETEEIIRARMLATVDPKWDVRQGSFIYDSLAPTAYELAQFYIRLKQVYEWAFVSWAFGEYLDQKAYEVGFTRKAATKATGVVRVSGTNGVIIPVGTIFSTQVDEFTESEAQLFVSTEAKTITNGVADVPVVAQTAGTAGNVGAGTVTMLISSIAGVTSVTNLSAMSGGTDEETDEELRARVLFRLQKPSAGGNKSDYVRWATEVTGVGGASVVPVRDGAGTVSIAIIDTDKNPASQALIDAVQDYIAPPWQLPKEAEDMTLGGYGVSTEDRPDDNGISVKMIYDAGGNGTVTHSNLHTFLTQPGIWQVRARVEVDSIAGVTDLLRVGVWNATTGAWAKTRPGGTVDAVVTFKASDLSTSWVEKIIEFYWNSLDHLELRCERLVSDESTILWIDRVVYRSAFSKDTGEGLAPVGARVTVEAGEPVAINVSATLTIATGYDAATVKAAVEANIETYLKSLAFVADNDVRYVRIGQAILDTPGVADYQNLLVNGGTANVVIGEQQVAVKGTVTLT